MTYPHGSQHTTIKINERNYWLVPVDEGRALPSGQGVGLELYDGPALRDIEPFEYDDLSGDNRKIRLLELESSTNPSADIHCELVEADYDNSFHIPTKVNKDLPRVQRADHERDLRREYDEVKETQIEYEALSWCWGTGKPEYAVMIKKGSKRFKKGVRKDLALALKYLRHTDRTRTLWVDALCINQDNHSERNHQVQMMSRVYTRAQQVCIWLGEDSIEDESKLAIDFIKEEITRLKNFDTLCTEPQYAKKWKALLLFMQRDWFSRRWVIQELALSRNATLFCGQYSLPWKQFAVAVELFVGVETRSHRLSEVMQKDEMLRHIPNWFEHVSQLGASLLVQATGSVFGSPILRRDPRNTPGSVSTVMRVATIDPLERRCSLSLEYLVSSMFAFQASEPRDVVYSLLAIARDAAPASADPRRPSRDTVHPQRFNRAALSMAEKQNLAASFCSYFLDNKPFIVDYTRPYSDVCREFVEFGIRHRCKFDPDQALDILCRPWALDPPTKSSDRVKGNEPAGSVGNRKPLKDIPLPSWVGRTSKAPFSIQPHPGADFLKTVRANADPLVGLPIDGHRNYNAAQTRKLQLEDMRFRRRPTLNHYSLYVKGFELDEVIEVTDSSQAGNIPKSWLDLVKWEDYSEDPPEELWRTLVANRGPDNRNPPYYYARACKLCVTKGGTASGRVDTMALINSERNSIIAEFCRRVQAVIWNRSLFRTADGEGRLGLASGVQKGDKICILYGCTVPVILRKKKKVEKDIQDENEVDRWEQCQVYFRRALERKRKASAYKEKKGGYWGEDQWRMMEDVRKKVNALLKEERKLRDEQKTLAIKDGHCSDLEGKFNEAEKMEYYYFVGECYLHGMMDGEAMQDKFWTEAPDRTFEIR